MGDSVENQQVEQKPAEVAIPDNIIKEAVANAVKTETERLKADIGLSPEKVAEILKEDRRKLASQILGEDATPKPDPILKALVDNPQGFVEAIRDLTLDSVEKRLEEKTQSEQEAERTRAQVREAFQEVMSDRKDITNNEASKQIYLSLYEKTDGNKPEADRMREALVKYDKYLDDLGLDRSKIKNAVSVDGSGGLPNQTSSPVSFEEMARQDQREKFAHFEKSMGRA